MEIKMSTTTSSSSLSNNNNVNSVENYINVNKRDDVRRTLMMVSHQQQGGRNFNFCQYNNNNNNNNNDHQQHQHEYQHQHQHQHDSVPDFVNITSKTTDPINFEDLTVIDDDISYNRNRDRNNNVVVNRINTTIPTIDNCIDTSTSNKSIIFSPTKLPKKSFVNTTTTVPPSQRVDYGDNEIVISSPTPVSKVFGTINEVYTTTCRNKYSSDVETKYQQQEFLVINDRSTIVNKKIKNDIRNKVYVPRRGTRPIRVGTTTQCSPPLKQVVDNNVSQINKEINVMPNIKQSNVLDDKKMVRVNNEYYYDQTFILSNEIQQQHEVQQRCSLTNTDLNDVQRHHQFQPPPHPIPLCYGKKSTTRSLISMNSSIDSLVSSSSIGGNNNNNSSNIIHRSESIGIDSILSTGSTAYELDCIITGTTTTPLLVRSSTACTLDPVPERTCTSGTVPVLLSEEEKNTALPLVSLTRPSNPMAMSLLQYHTSIATIDSTTTTNTTTSSRMSYVSSSTIGSPPPIIIPSTSMLNCSSSNAIHLTKCYHEYYHHNHNHHHYTHNQNYSVNCFSTSSHHGATIQFNLQHQQYQPEHQKQQQQQQQNLFPIQASLDSRINYIPVLVPVDCGRNEDRTTIQSYNK